MLQSEVKVKKCPNWPELSAKRLMPIMSLSPSLAVYLPDWAPGKREPDRDFLWTLINHCQPSYGKKLINEALRIRAQNSQLHKRPEATPLNLPGHVVDELLHDTVLHCKFRHY
jgi:hypothetical protein